jgi:two-component system phosphate regulon response regulator PhoB
MRHKQPPCVVLVAETDAATRITYRHALAGEDYLVFAADNGADTLAKAAELLPDLIVLDVDLGEPSGAHVYRELLSKPETRTIPVVLLIGDLRDPEEVTRGYFLEKPAAPDVLVAMVRKAMRRSRRLSIPRIH